MIELVIGIISLIISTIGDIITLEIIGQPIFLIAIIWSLTAMIVIKAIKSVFDLINA